MNKDREGWYDVSTLKGRTASKARRPWPTNCGAVRRKTAGRYSLSHRRGVGLIGMCKAFDEMQEMGWIGSERPRMVAVQAEG